MLFALLCSSTSDIKSKVRSSLGGRPSTAVSSAYAAATTPVSAMAAPRRPLPAHAPVNVSAERRLSAPVLPKTAVPKTAPSKPVARPATAPAPTPAAAPPARTAPAPSVAHSSGSKGHMSATPLLAHSSEHIPAGLAATLEHIVGQVCALLPLLLSAVHF